MDVPPLGCAAADRALAIDLLALDDGPACKQSVDVDTAMRRHLAGRGRADELIVRTEELAREDTTWPERRGERAPATLERVWPDEGKHKASVHEVVAAGRECLGMVLERPERKAHAIVTRSTRREQRARAGKHLGVWVERVDRKSGLAKRKHLTPRPAADIKRMQLPIGCRSADEVDRPNKLGARR